MKLRGKTYQAARRGREDGSIRAPANFLFLTFYFFGDFL